MTTQAFQIAVQVFNVLMLAGGLFLAILLARLLRKCLDMWIDEREKRS